MKIAKPGVIKAGENERILTDNEMAVLGAAVDILKKVGLKLIENDSIIMEAGRKTGYALDSNDVVDAASVVSILADVINWDTYEERDFQQKIRQIAQ